MSAEEFQKSAVMIQRVFEEMYLGNGKNDPSVLTRLDRIEQVLEQLKSWKWILAAATISMVADIIMRHIR